MITHTLSVRLYDTDAMGILYFGSQFRFAQDMTEIALGVLGIPITTNLAVRHASANYIKPVVHGTNLMIKWTVLKIGTTAFTSSHKLAANNHCVGDVHLTHVSVDPETRKKMPLPNKLRTALQAHLVAHDTHV